MLHGPPADVPRIASTLTNCFTDVSHWCAAKRLQLNASKTEVLWFGSAVNLSKMSPSESVVCTCSTAVDSTTVVRNLGVMFDAELSMREHVSRVAQVFFFHLRRLRPCALD